jgi:hypothetical protein
LLAYARDISEKFPFLAFSFPDFTQNAPVQVRNRMTGAAMSLIKKIDVKKHCADRRAMRLVAARPVSQPDTAGLSKIKPAGMRTSPPGFIEDFILEHTSSNVSVTSMK